MADINVEKLKEKLYPAAKALFMIGETLVDVSKQHISAEDAIDKIRSYMYDVDVIGSRYRVNALIAECMKSVVCNSLDEEQVEWLKEYLKMAPLTTEYDEPSIDVTYPSCCDGCSNNPKNGGSGICNCTLPYMQNPTTYTVKQEDLCMVNSTSGYVYTTDTKLTNASTVNIAEAVERTKKYIKEE